MNFLEFYRLSAKFVSNIIANIRVIAAITLPAVIKNYKAKVFRTRFLQANVIIHEGVRRAYLDNIDLLDMMNNNSPELSKYFKITNCKLPANASDANYFKKLNYSR